MICLYQNDLPISENDLPISEIQFTDIGNSITDIGNLIYRYRYMGRCTDIGKSKSIRISDIGKSVDLLISENNVELLILVKNEFPISGIRYLIANDFTRDIGKSHF